MWDLAEQLTVLAQAEGGQAANSQGCQMTMLMFGVMIFVFYFIVIRPQRKQQNEHDGFLKRLKVDDRVITTSGIFGRIVDVGEVTVTVDVGDRTRIRFLRAQVSRFQSEDERDSAPSRGGRRRGPKKKAADSDSADSDDNNTKSKK